MNRHLLTFLFDEISDSGGGSPTSTPTPSAPSAPATSGQPSAPVSATPTAPQAPAEDRSSWVPPHRLRETREAAYREAQQAMAQRDAQWQNEYQRIQQQLHALVGVQPQQDPERQAVRDQFGQLYPGLSALEQRAQDLQALLDRSGDIDNQNSHYWQSYGRQTMDRLFERAHTSLGSPLTEDGKRSLHQSFLGFVQSSPEMSERYANDPSIVDDFWKTFTSSFIDPARRAASATVVGRAGVQIPQDTPGGVPRGTPAPQPGNLDDRVAAAWQIYQQTNKA